jgi:hypothetical protein
LLKWHALVSRFILSVQLPFMATGLALGQPHPEAGALSYSAPNFDFWTMEPGDLLRNRKAKAVAAGTAVSR